MIATRRMRAYLLLPLLLILSQQGAWLHELSHVVYAAGAHHISVEQAQSTFENGVCPSCQSFGQLGSALFSSTAEFVAPVIQLCPQNEPQYASPAEERPAPRNRGPPHLA